MTPTELAYKHCCKDMWAQGDKNPYQYQSDDYYEYKEAFKKYWNEFQKHLTRDEYRAWVQWNPITNSVESNNIQLTFF